MSKFAKGLLFGSLVGGIGGLLFAPRSGQETRKKITDELEDFSEKKQTFDDSLDHFKESLNAFQEAVDIYVEPFVDGVTRDINKFQFQVEPRLAQIQEQAEKIQAELPEIPEIEQ